MSYKYRPDQLNSPIVRFVISFLGLFLLFYYFNIAFFSLTTPGGRYNPLLAEHLNYIHWLRQGLLKDGLWHAGRVLVDELFRLWP